MKCPHCDKEIPGPKCPQCGAITPEGSNYCMECGVSLGQKAEDIIEDANGFDFEDRMLCPDGTCTGILVEGRCTECEKVFDQKEIKADD